MDKQLLKAYIRTVVEEEVKRILPEMLSEAVREVKQLKENVTPAPTTKKPPIGRAQMAAMLGLEYDRENGVLSATTSGMSRTPAATGHLTITDDAGNPRHIPVDRIDPEVVTAVTKNYSELMKAMKIT
jgi:hypothetical protein